VKISIGATLLVSAGVLFEPFSDNWPDLLALTDTCGLCPAVGPTVVASESVEPDVCLVAGVFLVGLLPGVKFDRTRSYVFSPSSASLNEDLDAENRGIPSLVRDPLRLSNPGLLLAALPDLPIPSSIALKGGLGGACGLARR